MRLNLLSVPTLITPAHPCVKKQQDMWITWLKFRPEIPSLWHRIQTESTPSVKIVPPGVTVVRLRDLNLRRTTDRQRLVSLFRCIALGEVAPAGDDGGDGVGGLQFLQSELDARIASRIVARGLTVQQVSVLTSVHYDAVKGWVADGLLAATRQHQEQGAPWVIELQSLVTFLLAHTPLSTLASSCLTTSRGLSATLVRHGVLPLVPASKRGTLVKLSDAFSAMGRGEIADCPIAGKQTLKFISPEVLLRKNEYQPVPGAPDG